MNKTVSRVLWIVAGVLLIVAGGACMLHPGATLSGLSFLLGMAMLFSGVVDIMIFATAKRAAGKHRRFICPESRAEKPRKREFFQKKEKTAKNGE